MVTRARFERATPSFGGCSENPVTYRCYFAIRKTWFGPVVPGSARKCHRVTPYRWADAGIEPALQLAIPGTWRRKTWCRCGATANARQSVPRGQLYRKCVYQRRNAIDDSTADDEAQATRPAVRPEAPALAQRLNAPSRRRVGSARPARRVWPFSPDRVRGADVLLGHGNTVSSVCKQIGVSNEKSARNPHDSGRFISW